MTKDTNWLNSDHYHCRKCGAIVECAVGIAHTVWAGVGRKGVCSACGTVHTEWERPNSAGLFGWLRG